MNNGIRETDNGFYEDIIIELPLGVHSRPSARLAQKAREFNSTVTLASPDGEVDAKSMLDILSLALKKSDQVRVRAKGPDAKEAITALKKILTDSGK